ncbi:type II toxin-antitoxin system RelE/ParE family toxin [Marinimicrobium sp. LS-A18]|uniref:type II toxin-antitoxin system RelE/ParE family toxin n=1 Tax=Marinimicrobium sp. LS-A18 TaxID=1381596 RepID=UPI0004639CA9|nr:type II toxin-antitoxin system RelE/ParE family toxin [Marinimicrobium sp. LS-A18]
MSEYRLSDEAEHDVAEMYRRGFWQFGEPQADKFFHQLFDSLELLASFPESGRAAEDIYPGLRRIEFNPYVIFYLRRDYGVYVLRLLKQSQIVKAEYIAQGLKSRSEED